MTGVTRALAEFAAGLRYDDIPPEMVARTKHLILDISGIMVRARHDTDSTAPMVRAVERLGMASGPATVMGDARGYAPSAAALLNGTLAHSLDFDDTHAEASLHSSAPIVPAAMAAAEMQGASGRDLIVACVAGYEVQIRLSLALGPSDHYDQGFHPTATTGVFGATVAAGRLLGLDADQMESAFGIALCQAAGSMQFLHDGAWTKRSHVGQSAANGLICATMAAEGFRGPGQAFEGQWGFLHSHAPNAQTARATEGLGEVWKTGELAVKPYPSCRYTHAAMDGIIALRTEHGLSADEVESIDIGLPRTGLKIVGIPAEAKVAPQSVVDGQFSMPFCAAVALRDGGLDWDAYARHLDDAGTRALCGRVTTAEDAMAEAAFPHNMAGRVRISARGRIFEKFVDCPKGEPANFLTEAELKSKFDGLTAPYMDAPSRDRFAEAIFRLEEANDVPALFALGRG